MKNPRKNRFGVKVKPKNFKKSILRLWGYFQEEKKMLSIIILLIIVDTVAVILAPYLIGKAVDLIQIKDTNLLRITLIALFLFYFIDTIITIVENVIIFGISQRIVKQMRNRLFTKLQNLPVSYFDKSSNGDIMSRLANDVDNISTGISDSIANLISGTLSIVLTITIMIYLSPLLTLCTIISIPFVFILTKFITKKTQVLFKMQQVELGQLNGHIEEMISGINIVKAFNYEEKSINHFKQINKDMLKVSTTAQIYSSLLMPMTNVINNIAFALISVVGAMLVTKNILTVGVIATFLSYSKSFARPLNSLANLFNDLQSALAGCERVFEILDEQEEKEDRKDCVKFDELKDNITFNNIYFGYKENENIIKNISLKIKANTSNAIIGETGSGKTTIVNLITRFYDVNKGSINIDGVNIRDYCKDSYRNAFGVVLQDSYLFSESIIENIRYGNLNATDNEVVDACKNVGAHNFILKLKDGYNTIINESGQELSQGQRQLLTIARCILKEPKILILDEATSSVDTKTELKIQETMLEIMKGRTTFIIAHRLSTIRNCDNIIVIQNGQISEMGNHEELMKLKGYYYNNVNILNHIK